MTPLTELNALAEKASSGPWYTKEYNSLGGEIGGPRRPILYASWAGDWPLDKQRADHAFIAACDPDTVRALVAGLRAAIAMRDHQCFPEDAVVDWAAYHTKNDELTASLDRALAVFAGKGVGA